MTTNRRSDVEAIQNNVREWLARPDVAAALEAGVGFPLVDIAAAVGVPAARVKQFEKALGGALRAGGLRVIVGGNGSRQWFKEATIGKVSSTPVAPPAPTPLAPARASEPDPVAAVAAALEAVPPLELPTIPKPDRAAEKRAAEKAAAEAAARERRLASNFERLRPEDFDLTVANDASSGAASSDYSKNRRQEFNLKMGEHYNVLQEVASRVAGGEDYAAIIADLPPEDAAYIGGLSEQERRWGISRMGRALSLYAAGEELHRRLFAAACRKYLRDQVVPTGYAAKPVDQHPKKRSVCLMLSDLHVGADLSGRENPEQFGPVEEARRLEYVMRQAIDYKPQYRRDSELVLMLNGDLIEGLLLHDFKDGAPLVEQKVALHKYLARMIGEFAAAFPSVRVYCQPGNHGRDKVRHPGRATSSKWDGHETMIYFGLSEACARLPNVRFDVRFRAMTAIDLHGQWFGLSHGDTEVKLGDPDTKSKDNLAILDKINASRIYGVEFAGWGFGHFHKPRYVAATPRVLFNGALIPPNGHARGAGYIAEAQGQWLWEAVHGYPIGDVRFIQVGREQDRDERLGSIIQPFRFPTGADAMLVDPDAIARLRAQVAGL